MDSSRLSTMSTKYLHIHECGGVWADDYANTTRFCVISTMNNDYNDVSFEVRQEQQLLFIYFLEFLRCIRWFSSSDSFTMRHRMWWMKQWMKRIANNRVESFHSSADAASNLRYITIVATIAAVWWMTKWSVACRRREEGRQRVS